MKPSAVLVAAAAAVARVSAQTPTPTAAPATAPANVPAGGDPNCLANYIVRQCLQTESDKVRAPPAPAANRTPVC